MFISVPPGENSDKGVIVLGWRVRGPELDSVVFKLRLGEVSRCRSTQPQEPL